MNVPSFSSANAWRSCACVFITMGPYQATGSSMGVPETRRKRMPSSPAWTVISSPRSKSTSEWLLTSYTAELATDDAHARAVVVGDLGYGVRRNVLVTRGGHLQRGREVGPELEAVHTPLGITLGHLLVQDATTGGHPLHVTGSHLALVDQAIAVLHGACEDVGDRLND